jgi:four helix bundle protein
MIMARGQDILERLVQFAAGVIRLVSGLPRTMEGKHIAGQLLRSGTAPAAHYGEACSAESPSDFVHKLKIAVKELNESDVWLRILVASDMRSSDQLAALQDECNQLQRILSASIKTARRNMHN